MFNEPVLQIHCRPDPMRQNLIMSQEDRSLLVRLAVRDITIRLNCGEMDACDVRVQSLVRQSRYNPTLKAWQVPIWAVGLVPRLPRV